MRPHGGAVAPPSGRRQRARNIPVGDGPGYRTGASTYTLAASPGMGSGIHLHVLGHIRHSALEPIGGHISKGASSTNGEAETERIKTPGFSFNAEASGKALP